MKSIGKLDRRITIEKRTLTKDATGGIVETWATHSKAWAERMDKNGKEAFVVDSDRGSMVTGWRIRYAPLLRGLNGTSGYRVSYGGLKFDIQHVTEEGRRDAMVLETTATEAIS